MVLTKDCCLVDGWDGSLFCGCEVFESLNCWWKVVMTVAMMVLEVAVSGRLWDFLVCWTKEGYDESFIGCFDVLMLGVS